MLAGVYSGDEALQAIGSSCPQLRVLRLYASTGYADQVLQHVMRQCMYLRSILTDIAITMGAFTGFEGPGRLPQATGA